MKPHEGIDSIELMIDNGRVKRYVFYTLRSQDIKHTDAGLSEDYSFKVWRPTMRVLVPRDLIRISFILWSFLHHLRLFESSHHGIFMIHHGKELIHYSVVLPKFFRLPFMAKNDLNIGPCWTHHKHRRKGIARYVIQRILELYRDQDRKFWYFTGEDNVASQRLTEKVGFSMCGKGIRNKRLGIGVIGAFVIEGKCCQQFPAEDSV